MSSEAYRSIGFVDLTHLSAAASHRPKALDLLCYEGSRDLDVSQG